MEAMTAPHRSAAALHLVEWGVAARTLAGQAESGDLHLVAAFPGGILIAVVDGLGHGPEAAVAARVAAATLRDHADAAPVDLVQRCHAALQRTRGVVLSLASIDAATASMSWLGVGNVDGTLYRADPAGSPPRESLAHRGGVVGYQLPPLRATTHRIARGDVLVLATDGISDGIHGGPPPGGPPPEWQPQAAADHIVERFGKQTDDALVLVARYVGASP
jgi:hypothetical protein